MERSHGTDGGVVDEAVRFARLMRELKERAGLSYGSLARRLHTSTSTLHRYCTGDAVPAEFAVVDRFARACGATGEEAVELHRAWLLADARRRAAAAGAAGGPPGLGAVQGPVSGAVPVEAPAPVAVQGPVRGPAPVAEAESGAGSVPVPVPVAESASGSGSVPVAPAGPASGSAPASGPWYRRRWGLGLAVAGVVAVVAGSAFVLAPTGRAPAGSAVLPSSSPSPTPAAKAPLRAAVRSHVWAGGCDHAYLAERGPGSMPPPPVEADAPAWADAGRAVHAGSQIVEVTLHGVGPGTEAVVLEDLEVRVTARRTPPAWNVYQMSQGCGGGLTPAGFAVNLDAPRPLARPAAGNDAGVRLAAPAFPLRVSAAEPVVLRVEATATGCDCDWSLDLRWTGPAGSGTLRLDDNGRPWRTSAATARPTYGYAHEQSRWSR
ncbi:MULTISPECIES: transcriptional regulator [unclassified Streptomyces]|uniref:transcriptional regulator n=1 Tax=unclassified Streptomyces TaxID=2593676 RepID=UPI0022579B2F|nr:MULTISPECIES: transcriptional regulator [unclassified Streptomyces]MCX4525310.1 helix-turn-helix domain-containing protein [Streptomyces sp. NBC_01551]MCX4544215.1 helix-turn-helix domain-containing protein [Streptomyces sp. NBC_01565]